MSFGVITLRIKMILMNSDKSSELNEPNESDTSGASLGGRDPSSLKIPMLKRWLVCRNAYIKGNKADLVLR